MGWLQLFNALWLLLVAFIQLSWIDQLPIVWLRPNLLLVILINWLALSGWRRINWWIIFLGLFLDCLAFYPFGSQTMLWILTMGLVNLLLINFFTNKSLTAFSGLVVIATIFQWFGRIIISRHWPANNWWLDLGGQILANWLLMIIIHYLIYWLDRRLNPLFLFKRR
jgi:cell shape-determining protein MreD